MGPFSKAPPIKSSKLSDTSHQNRDLWVQVPLEDSNILHSQMAKAAISETTLSADSLFTFKLRDRQEVKSEVS
jgi:hypothetical protein